MEDSTGIVADGGWQPRTKFQRRWTRIAAAVCVLWIPVTLEVVTHFCSRSGDVTWTGWDSLAALGGFLQIGWVALTLVLARREPARKVTVLVPSDVHQDPRKLY